MFDNGIRNFPFTIAASGLIGTNAASDPNCAIQPHNDGVLSLDSNRTLYHFMNHPAMDSEAVGADSYRVIYDRSIHMATFPKIHARNLSELLDCHGYHSDLQFTDGKILTVGGAHGENAHAVLYDTDFTVLGSSTDVFNPYDGSFTRLVNLPNQGVLAIREGTDPVSGDGGMQFFRSTEARLIADITDWDSSFPILGDGAMALFTFRVSPLDVNNCLHIAWPWQTTNMHYAKWDVVADKWYKGDGVTEYTLPIDYNDDPVQADLVYTSGYLYHSETVVDSNGKPWIFFYKYNPTSQTVKRDWYMAEYTGGWNVTSLGFGQMVCHVVGQCDEDDTIYLYGGILRNTNDYMDMWQFSSPAPSHDDWTATELWHNDSEESFANPGNHRLQACCNRLDTDARDIIFNTRKRVWLDSSRNDPPAAMDECWTCNDYDVGGVALPWAGGGMSFGLIACREADPHYFYGDFGAGALGETPIIEFHYHYESGSADGIQMVGVSSAIESALEAYSSADDSLWVRFDGNNPYSPTAKLVALDGAVASNSDTIALSGDTDYWIQFGVLADGDLFIKVCTDQAKKTYTTKTISGVTLSGLRYRIVSNYDDNNGEEQYIAGYSREYHAVKP